jgi:hypothetical protein
MLGAREQLIRSVATRMRDYRGAELGASTLDHVERWIAQFSDASQVTVLRETDRLLARCYWSEDRVTDALRRVLTSRRLFGASPRTGLAESQFLSRQPEGKSQHDLLVITDGLLADIYGTSLSECRGDRRFVYVDDCLFSGDTTVRDLRGWLS